MARGRDTKRISSLQRIPLFAELSKKELQFLAAMTTELTAWRSRPR